jgi:DNA-binding beta-propeller fold protein YncE
MCSARFSHKPAWLAAPSLALAFVATPSSAAQQPAASAALPPTADYWVYVGAESADQIHRIRFGPAGAVVEKTIPVGEIPTEMEGPHGLVISADGQYLHMTTGHGVPDGKYWRFALGPDTLVGEPTFLGMFPASIDVTPDGLYSFSANFNLHGDMVPSTISVVYTPTNTEIARVVTCVMPHGSRIEPSGAFHYSGCMMDDQLVEIDTRSFEVSRRFSLAKGREGAVPVADHADHAAAGSPGRPIDPAEVGYAGNRHAMEPNTCSPTWALPSPDGRTIYVACNKADEIVEIDRAAWTIARRLKTGRGPYNLAATPDGKLLLATLKQGGMFEIFDRASGRSLAQLKNSTTVAHGVAVSSDSRYAFVSSEGVGAAPGKVDIYDLAALVRVASVDVGQQASGIAFWKMEPPDPDSASPAESSRAGVDARVQPDSAIPLPGVVVEARSPRLVAAGFFERKARGGGTLFTRAEIVALGASSLPDLFARVPGLRRAMNADGSSRVDSRGGRTIMARCAMQYIIDGVRSEIGPAAVEAIPVHAVEGIEVYRGASELPTQFDHGRAMCGAIVIWTRGF